MTEGLIYHIEDDIREVQNHTKKNQKKKGHETEFTKKVTKE